MSWDRYEGKALADTTLSGEALNAALEDYVRAKNPHLTDVRLHRAAATDSYDTGSGPRRRWYEITYVADDGEGY